MISKVELVKPSGAPAVSETLKRGEKPCFKLW